LAKCDEEKTVQDEGACDYILIAAKYKLANILATRIKVTLGKTDRGYHFRVISNGYCFNGNRSDNITSMHTVIRRPVRRLPGGGLSPGNNLAIPVDALNLPKIRVGQCLPRIRVDQSRVTTGEKIRSRSNCNVNNHYRLVGSGGKHHLPISSLTVGTADGKAYMKP
jgi:hypothetical protein